ncbi:MAG: S4 domain-containing protein, partial [Chloroflexota bacterium]
MDDPGTLSLVADSNGLRLDRYLHDRCPQLSRTRLQKLIAEGQVTVNGQAARASLKLEAGNRVAVKLPPATSDQPQPEVIPIKVLYQDDDVLVVDKPAGLSVHPAPGHPDHTLVNALLARFPHLPPATDALRPGIVHRLDKDT